HFNQQLIPFFEFIANVTNAVFSDLTNMQQSVRAGENLHEGAKIREPDYLAEIGLAQLGLGHKVLDHLKGLAGRSFVGGSDVDLAVIFHVDLYPRLLDNAANHLAPRPDQFADLLPVDLQGVDAGSILGDLRARLGEGL